MIKSKSLQKKFKHLNNIAIVGNGPINKNYSKQIDNSDLVIRINNFVLNENVGKKVDICYVNCFDLVKDNQKHNCSIVLAHINSGNTIASNSQNLFYIDNSQYQYYIDILKLEKNKIPLTGVIAVLEFYTNNNHINLYGFDFFQSGVKYYFKNDIIATKQHMDRYHNIAYEEKYLKEKSNITIHY